MVSTQLQKILQELLHTALNMPVSSLQMQRIGGGSINDTYKLAVNGKEHLFAKINSATKFPFLFKKEKNGLEFIQQQHIIKVPRVVACAVADDTQVLVLEWIDSGVKTNASWEAFGENLARLHQVTGNNFGFDEDNYMGNVEQVNPPTPDWISFFAEQRLAALVHKCRDKSLLSSLHVQSFQKLYSKLGEIFSEERPSLQHGDLWSGNYMCTKESEPVLIDPAVYFGHRSVDLGMTTLFGGFDSRFYEAYHYHYPFPANYPEQWKVCNLYPLLIHLLLFGKSYLSSIVETLHYYQ